MIDARQQAGLAGPRERTVISPPVSIEMGAANLPCSSRTGAGDSRPYYDVLRMFKPPRGAA
ncbi:MAG TPA: hypothetical protein VGQ27_12245 [Steroidobacteraceae bacterium]|nr:hypothetical protein [Steroidobacteraceae bacterium]